MASKSGSKHCVNGPIAVQFGALPDLGSLESEWRGLEARSDAAFFLTWDWIGCWLQATGSDPHLLVARRDGKTVGLALLQACRGDLYLNQTGDPGRDSLAIEFNGILAQRGDEDAVLRACFDALTGDRSGRPEWRALHLAGATRRVHDRLGEVPAVVRSSVRRRSPLVDLDSIRRQGVDHIATLGRNTRHQIRRSLRLYQRAGNVSLRRAATVGQALDYLDALKSLHQATWTARGKPGAFAAAGFESFHRRLIETAFAAGAIDLLHIAAGDDTIGYLYNFIHQGQVYNYQSGLAYGEDRKYKPGLISHNLAIESYLSRDMSRYHFMAGEDRYKYSLSNGEDELYWIVIWSNRANYLLNETFDFVRRAIRHFRRIFR